MRENKIPKFQKCPVGGLFWPLRASHGPCVHAKGLKMIPCERLIDSGPFEKKDDLVWSSRSRDITQKANDQNGQNDGNDT